MAIHVCIVYPLWIRAVAKLSLRQFWHAAKRPIACAFGTNSSLATVPLTLHALDSLGVSKSSSRLGTCIGTNFNNDGILLYEAMAVLFGRNARRRVQRLNLSSLVGPLTEASKRRIDKEKRQVAFTIFVDPGKRVYVRRINVAGNTRTKDEVIRREMRQMEGGWISTAKVERSKVRLQRLGYFEEVNVETPAVPGTSDQMDVNYTVKERPSGNLMIGASGTVTTVSAHHLGLKRYNRMAVDGSRIARDSILRICDKLSLLSVDELTTLPCIGDDRADLALAGGAILEAVCRQWAAPVVRVADRGLREGLLMDLINPSQLSVAPGQMHLAAR